MSLVEVLAALAVFVIGILIIVRLFPPGFFIVKQSENHTLANRLAQAELERLKGTPLNLPAGILGWDIVNGGVLVDMDPEDMRELPGLGGFAAPVPPDPYYYSDVNKFRRIYAESTKIPAPMSSPKYSTTADPLISMYVLNFSPVDHTTAITVRSGPMRRRSVPESGKTVKSSSEYAIDYDTAKLYVRPVNYPRSYVVSYSYWVSESRPRLVSVPSAVVPVDAGLSDVPILLPAGGGAVSAVTGFMRIDNGSETVHRNFDLLGIAAPFAPGNPYQFKILDAVQGVIAFNPAGFGYEEVTTWGRVPLTAYIDYDVLDWHIMREERKLPETIISPTDLDVKLTLRYIKNSGNTNAAPPIQPVTVEMNGNNYAGLSPALPYSILAIDIRTGEWFNEASHLNPSDASSNFAMKVDYKDGIIHFDETMAGRTFRIYYRAEGDWALQVFKSYETYRQSGLPANSNDALDYREWHARFVTASDNTRYYVHDLNQPSAPGGLLHFAKCYSGMSVALDYTYRIKTGSNYTYYDVDGDTYQTDMALGRDGTCAIDPRSRIAKLRGVGVDAVEIIRITKVYGVSVGARVIWREGGRGFNGGQWKKIDLQTYLMRLQD